MTTLVPNRHPALDTPEPERADYLTVIASMAFADDEADERELERVRDLCNVLELSEESASRVVAVASGKAPPNIDETLTRLRQSELKFALMVDAIDIAYADDEIVPAEAEELHHLAEILHIDAGQLEMLQRYVEARTHHEHKDSEANREVATGLASAGIPAAALGIATLAGVPIAAGLGIAAALGVGSFFSLRWLLKRKKDDETADDAA
jgi:uncharacterized tellurite resistance protein B-like protein